MVFAFALSLAGCATKAAYVRQSVQANLVMEDVSNKVLLLNIVRAYKKRPMHFSTFERLSGPAGFGATSQSIQIPFGPGGSGSYPLTFGFGLDRPNFAVLPLDKQEFTRGFTSPIPLKTLSYYFDQGWPRHMLLLAFLRQIDVADKDGTIKETYRNYPQNFPEFTKFQEYTRQIAACRISSRSIVTSEEPLGPVLTRKEMSDPEKIAIAASHGLSVVKLKNDKYQLKRTQKGLALQLSSDGARDIPCAPAVAVSDSNKSAVVDDEKLILHVRSPEAIVYYLGEIARAQLDGVYGASGVLDSSRKPMINVFSTVPGQPSDTSTPLFVLNRGKPSEHAIEVDHEGETYWIPTESAQAGRSLHLLSLVTQLIGLQKSATDLPTSSTVQLVQ